jgi:dTDP-4-dehydrorhamnose reductase
MRVLILGATGMAGHKLWQAYRDRYEVWGTARTISTAAAASGLFDPTRMICEVEAADPATVARAIDVAEPEVVVNCIGIVKQAAAVRDPIASITVNSLFPHRLARLCRDRRCRLIHLSTDCVFSGRKGAYTEDDLPDPGDLYGRSKLLGEVSGEGALTLRSSIIGRELATSNGLVEWFLAQSGKAVPGYRRAIYSGFTTLAMARIISGIIDGPHGCLARLLGSDQQVRSSLPRSPRVRRRGRSGAGCHPHRGPQPRQRAVPRLGGLHSPLLAGDGPRNGRRPNALRIVEDPSCCLKANAS